MRKMITIFLTLLGVFLLGACGLDESFNFNRSWRGGDFTSNGERIYFTATNEAGEAIYYSGGPGSGGMMMSQSLSCASCHSTNGRGGVHTMHMEVMDAPDVRYAALRGEGGEHAEGSQGGDTEEDHDEDAGDGHDEEGGDSHDDAHSEYDLEDFRRAVVEGEHPDGESLDRDMPRWELSDEDLVDLFEYLKTLP